MFNFISNIILGETHQEHIQIFFTSPETVAKIYKESNIKMTEQNVSNDEFHLGFRDQSGHDRNTGRTFWTGICLCLSLTLVGTFVLVLMISRFIFTRNNPLHFFTKYTLNGYARY